MTDYDMAGYARRFAVARRLNPEVGRVWIDALSRAARAGVRADVLDLGAGVGRFVPILLEAWQAERVVAVDQSMAMLREMAPDLAGTAVRADMAVLPFRRGSLDACLCSMVLHYSRDPVGVCREIHRVLRPRGVLCVRTGAQETVASFSFLRYFPTARRAERRAMPERAEVVGWLLGAGFTDVVVEGVRTTPRSRWGYCRKVLSRGFPSLQLVPTHEFIAGASMMIVSTIVLALLRRPIRPEETLLVTGISA